jgi:hypothetical protein
VDEVLAETGRVQQRNRLLPARLVVYFVLAMCLFSGQSYEELARLLTAGRLARAVKATHTELLERPLPPRRRRANPRVIKRKVAGWPLKRAARRAADRPTIAAITLVGATKPKRGKRTSKH